jgi:predicted aldo/keto reductase-like oxidoreductase
MDIPSMMRSYMYAYGYRNLAHAKHTFYQSRVMGNPCRDCITCSVDCTAGFDIKQKVEDIARIQDIPGDFLHG